VGVDLHHQKARFAQGGGEVGDVGRFILAAEKDLVFGDFPVAGGGGDLLDKIGCTRRVVCHREGTLEDVTVAVADEGNVFALGVVEGNTDDLAGIPGVLTKGAKSRVLAAVD